MAGAPEGAHRARWRLFRLRARAALLSRRLPGRTRLLGGLEHGAMAAVAAILAYWPTRTLALREGFWAAITAIAVLQIKIDATRDTARDQFIGAAVGGLIGGALASIDGFHIWVYAGAVIAAIVTCWCINVPSAARLSATTATIILLVPHQGSALAMVEARMAEVAWGVTVALAVVWVADALARRFRRN